MIPTRLGARPAVECDYVMHHDEPIFLVRRKPIPGDDDIPLEEWLSYVASSSILLAKPRVERQGINPFTKQPTILRSPQVGAFFEGPRGRCEVEYHAGGLIIRGAFGHAETIVTQIAADLGAKAEAYDPNAGTTGGA